ncbi:hypothetical protein HYH02_001196 [Chlamydomonas schloesseri]|uniref:MAGE domain-containing protein n=1 Tax=Chlamydomonas schloesseri TaxID=2026947 RepID=A0A836BC77_9CHLO|nr:hypothetical protein HYH02_001196 [Chlamydomonas schloesseri]|eukprot:KAG2454161.1 hypothetical protein HYH02_001196 [Chlamydomonas schloesseri]
MSQRPQRAAKRQYADENSEGGTLDGLDDDDSSGAAPRARRGALAPAGDAANASKRPRREDAGRKRSAAAPRRGAGEGADDEEPSGGESASEGSEDEADHDVSDGDDGINDHQPKRGRAGGARGRRGGARGGGRTGRGAEGAGRGRGGRGSSSAAAGVAASDNSSDVIIISSDSDDVAEGGAAGQATMQVGASMRPFTTAAAGGRGGRGSRAGGATRGRGRGRGRGSSQAPPAEHDCDADNAADDDGGDAGGVGQGGSGTQAVARRDGGAMAAARFAGGATGPIQIDPAELVAMRRKIRQYKEEYQAAVEKCDVWNDVSNADKQELARVVVRHMLFATRQKPGVPVARTKLMEAVKKAMGTHRHYKKLASVWMPWARFMAISTMGYDIAEVTPRPESIVGAEVDAAGAAGTAAGASGSNANGAAGAAAAPAPAAAPAAASHYVLRTVLPTELRLQMVGPGSGPGEGSDEWGLTMMVLSLIRLNNNKMEEAQLKRMLGEVGFPEGSAHPVLGPIDAQLKRMQDQRYLTADKTTTTQADGRQERLLMWGDAAFSEVGTKVCDKWMEKWFELKESAAMQVDGEEQQEVGNGAGAAGAQ